MKHNSHFKGDFAKKISKSEIIKLSYVVEKIPISKDWNVKFGVDVHQMLQLASMELKASKIQVDHVVKEKQRFLDQHCIT